MESYSTRAAHLHFDLWKQAAILFDVLNQIESGRFIGANRETTRIIVLQLA